MAFATTGTSSVSPDGMAWSWTGCMRFGNGHVKVGMGTPEDPGVSAAPKLSLAPDPCTLGAVEAGFAETTVFDPMSIEVELGAVANFRDGVSSGFPFMESSSPVSSPVRVPSPSSGALGQDQSGPRDTSRANVVVSRPVSPVQRPVIGDVVKYGAAATAAHFEVASLSRARRDGASPPRSVRVASSPIRPGTTSPSRSVVEFVARVRAPLPPTVSLALPKPRTAKLSTPAVDTDTRRRSTRLAAKSKYRAATAELQARNVLLTKLGVNTSQALTSEAAAAACRATFGEQLSAGKRAAIRELFPSTVWVEEASSPCVA